MPETFSPESFQNEPMGVGREAIEKNLAEHGCQACELARRAYKALFNRLDSKN